MMLIEEAIIDTLRRNGPCCLDDVVTYLPNLSWGEVFLAVDRMSRDGRVLLRQLDHSYRIALRSQLASSRSPSGHKGAYALPSPPRAV